MLDRYRVNTRTEPPFVPTIIGGKRVWVAGHTGMVGSALARRLKQVEGVTLVTSRRSEVDLVDRGAVDAFVERERPDLVFLAAARVGGILANDTHPVDFLEDNLYIATNVIAASHAVGVEKLLFLGSSCVYPKLAPQPIREDSLLTGPLEPTNQWYAVAKIAGLKLCEAYRRQHGANFISVMPTNLYGPNDNYDLASSHVVAAFIRKFHEAKVEGRPEVVIWGSGTPLREFMHVDDLADACVHLMRHYDGAQPINVGSGEETTILELAHLVADVIGWRGELRHDRTKPDGTPRKLMDSARLRSELGWAPSIPLREGLASAYADFVERLGRAAA